MADDHTEQRMEEGKMEWIGSSPNMSEEATKKWQDIGIHNLKEAPGPLRDEVEYDMSDTKEKVYSRLVEYLQCEPYPSEDELDGPYVHDIVNAVLLPTLSDFKRKSQRGYMTLYKRGEMMAVDEGADKTKKEFVVIDFISLTEEEEKQAHVVVVETKKSTLVIAFRVLLLALQDMWGACGGKGIAYGFVTTGEEWQVVVYDGRFRVMNRLPVMFSGMEKAEMKGVWMEEFSIVVELIYQALQEGGKEAGWKGNGGGGVSAEE